MVAKDTLLSPILLSLLTLSFAPPALLQELLIASTKYLAVVPVPSCMVSSGMTLAYKIPQAFTMNAFLVNFLIRFQCPFLITVIVSSGSSEC